MIGTLFAYGAVLLLKMHYEAPDVYLVDARNIFLAMALGIFIGQRNAKTNIMQTFDYMENVLPIPLIPAPDLAFPL